MRNVDHKDNLIFTHLSDVSSIVFGLSSGVLTLVGLIAIFISINSQHNIQKAREILWSIKEYTLPYYPYNFTKEIKFEIYKKIWSYQETLKKSNGITPVVFLTAAVMVYVGVVWFSFYRRAIGSFSHFEQTFLFWVTLFAIIILGLFLLIIFLLINTKRLGKLPKVSTLLDTNNNFVDSIVLASSFIQLQIWYDNEEGVFGIGVSYPIFAFKGFNAYPSIKYYTKEDVDQMSTMDRVNCILRDKSQKLKRVYVDGVRWRNYPFIEDFKIPPGCKEIHIEVEIESEQGKGEIWFPPIKTSKLIDIQEKNKFDCLELDIENFYPHLNKKDKEIFVDDEEDEKRFLKFFKSIFWKKGN